jgi:hypothetical protein
VLKILTQRSYDDLISTTKETLTNQIKDELTPKIEKEQYNLGFEDGLDAGYFKGFQHGTEKGYITAIDDMNQSVTEYEQQKQISQTSLDDLMLYYKYLGEITNSNFFKSMIFMDLGSKDIKNIIEYIDYCLHTHEIKLQYPQTVDCFPKLKNAFEQIYDNKLVVEEAEGKMK